MRPHRLSSNWRSRRKTQHNFPRRRIRWGRPLPGRADQKPIILTPSWDSLKLSSISLQVGCVVLLGRVPPRNRVRAGKSD